MRKHAAGVCKCFRVRIPTAIPLRFSTFSFLLFTLSVKLWYLTGFNCSYLVSKLCTYHHHFHAGDGDVRVWHIGTKGTQVCTLRGAEGSLDTVTAACVNAAHTHVAFGDSAGNIRVYNMAALGDLPGGTEGCPPSTITQVLKLSTTTVPASQHRHPCAGKNGRERRGGGEERERDNKRERENVREKTTVVTCTH